MAGAERSDIVMPPFLAVVAHADGDQGVAQEEPVGLLGRGEAGIERGGAGIQKVVAPAHIEFAAGFQVDDGNIDRDSPAVL